MLAFLSSLFLNAQIVTIDVNFKMTEFEKPDAVLAGVPVRLVLGESPDWQEPKAGHRFVTDAKGEAHFAMPGFIDRRWQSVFAFFFTRTDHLLLAAELEQQVPDISPADDQAGAGKDKKYNRFQWLYQADIDRLSSGDCSTSGITEVYTRDANGKFTVQGDSSGSDGRDSLTMPELKGMHLNGPGYKLTDYMLQPAEGHPGHWTLNLWLERKPPPVWR